MLLFFSKKNPRIPGFVYPGVIDMSMSILSSTINVEEFSIYTDSLDKDLRYEDISLNRYIQRQLSLNRFHNIDVVDGFPEDESLSLPIVSLEHILTNDSEIELNTNKSNSDREYEVNVYARTKGERDDIISCILGLAHEEFDTIDYRKVEVKSAENSLTSSLMIRDFPVHKNIYYLDLDGLTSYCKLDNFNELTTNYIIDLDVMIYSDQYRVFEKFVLYDNYSDYDTNGVESKNGSKIYLDSNNNLYFLVGIDQIDFHDYISFGPYLNKRTRISFSISSFTRRSYSEYTIIIYINGIQVKTSTIITNNTMSTNLDKNLYLGGSYNSLELINNTYDLGQISSSDFHCVGIKNGTILTWGSSPYIIIYPGGTHVQIADILTVPGDNSNFVKVSANTSNSMGLKSNGFIVTWGTNDYGENDIPVELNSNFVNISAGAGYNVGLKGDGSVLVCGISDYGLRLVPDPNNNFVAVSAGGYHILGLRSDGSITAWGNNSYGQCDVPSPNIDFVAISAGSYFSLGLKSDGSVTGWGFSQNGEINVPEPNSDFISISAGTSCSVGLKSDNTLVSWGSEEDRINDLPIPNSDFIEIDVGTYYAIARRLDGTIVAWGNIEFLEQSNVPKQLSHLYYNDSNNCKLRLYGLAISNISKTVLVKEGEELPYDKINDIIYLECNDAGNDKLFNKAATLDEYDYFTIYGGYDWVLYFKNKSEHSICRHGVIDLKTRCIKTPRVI